jgi:hypothetical protein
MCDPVGWRVNQRGEDVGARARGGRMQGIKPDRARRECAAHDIRKLGTHRKGLLVGGARGLQTPTSGGKKAAPARNVKTGQEQNGEMKRRWMGGGGVEGRILDQ